MATLGDIGFSAAINILSAFCFLIAFVLIRIHPINDRVYFTKWYISGQRSSPRSRAGGVSKFVNLDARTYLTFLNWIPQALGMSEAEIIRHAGLDSAVFLRIYTLGLKIFGPIAVIALLVLIPVNASGGTLFFLELDLVVSNIDKLSISNVHAKSSNEVIELEEMWDRFCNTGFWRSASQRSDIVNERYMQCQFVGPFPLAVKNLVDLTRLDLHNNKLTGPITPQIG